MPTTCKSRSRLLEPDEFLCRDLYVPGGMPDGGQCTRANMDFTIEGELVTEVGKNYQDRPVVDLEFRVSSRVLLGALSVA